MTAAHSSHLPVSRPDLPVRSDEVPALPGRHRQAARPEGPAAPRGGPAVRPAGADRRLVGQLAMAGAAT